MDELTYVYLSVLTILSYFVHQVVTGKFDPFAPVWLFLVGFVQVYVIQALSYHDWAMALRGKELVTEANFRSFWALWLFLCVYNLPLGKLIARILPAAPSTWSPKVVAVICPPLAIWGLICAGVTMGSSAQADTQGADESLLRQFPFVMIVAGVMLIVAGRTSKPAAPALLGPGLFIAFAYVMIWMFNGKRSHSLIGVLASVCAFYVGQQKRPSWPVLIATAFAGSLVVAVAIGWRNNTNYERSVTGFTHYLGDFQVTKILESLNISDAEDDSVEEKSYETAEYGGFLLMMDTVPERSGYDYGESYLRIFSTFIPRVLWPTKPYYGRAEWVSAWIAGSELERDEDFTGPAIGILGATQLNGGVMGTLIVLTCAGLILRTAYEFFRRYSDSPWAQFWWSITFFNAWLMVVADDPLTWFYYNWGFTTFPVVVLMWFLSKRKTAVAEVRPSRAINYA